MKYVWYVLAMCAFCVLAAMIFFENLPKMVFNLFHRRKKKISWEIMDDSERYYHE